MRRYTYNGVTVRATGRRSSDRDDKAWQRTVRHNGREVTVHYADPDMPMRRTNDAARANFLRRHNCGDKTDPTAPGFWSCYDWANPAEKAFAFEVKARLLAVRADSVPDDVADPALWRRVRGEARRKFNVYPSAYANGWLVQEYERRGGTYKALDTWFDEEDWVDISQPRGRDGYPPCGSRDGEGAAPKCLPRARANRLTEDERQRLVRRKRDGGGRGEHVSSDPDDLREKGAVIVVKGAGKRRMFLVASNPYRDREDDIVKEAALRAYVDEFAGNDLKFWHHGHPIGRIVKAEMVGPFLVEEAVEADDRVIVTRTADGRGTRVTTVKAVWDEIEADPARFNGASIGFRYRLGDKGSDGAFRRIYKHETSILPHEAAANAYTYAEVSSE